MAESRRAYIKVIYDGADITKDISETVINMQYTDKASGEADDLTLKCHDRDGKWIKEWYPKKVSANNAGNASDGVFLRVKIITGNWNGEGNKGELDCGCFEVDTVEFGGPPDNVSIKAVSTPLTTGMRREAKTRNKENTTLKEWAQMIAGDAGLSLVYEVETEIKLDRVDQWEKSDMEFLLELCGKYGVSLKVTTEKLVLFEERVYEAKPEIETFDKKGDKLITYSFAQNSGDCVSKVVTSYKDSEAGELVETEYDVEDAPATGQTAIVNERVGDLGGDNFREGKDTASKPSGGTFDTGFNVFNETAKDFESIRADKSDLALLQAKAKAREKNKDEWTCTLNVAGNVKMVAGVNFKVKNFGVYDGKYAVVSATHTAGGGYTTEIKGRKVLKY
jgi:phage protein D